MLKSATGRDITRRSFLKTTVVTAAGVAALGGLAGCSSGEEPPAGGDAPAPAEEVKVFSSCSGNCSSWGCPCYLTLREGKVADIERAPLTCPDGSPSPYQETCAKGYSNIERMYSATRVTTPLKRAGERGAGQWEQISWDQAVKEITDKWKELQAEHGNDTVAFLSGSGSVDSTIKTYAGRLQALMGGMTVSNCYDNTGVFCQYNHGAGIALTMGGHNEYRDIPNAKNVFVWGSNPTESLIIDYHFITEAQDNGAKLIVIDPIYTTTASKADMYVSIRPGSDGLLAAGMAQIAIRDGFVDKKHVQTLTVGPFLVKDSDGMYLRLSDLGQAEAGSEYDRIMVWEGGKAVAFDAATDPEIEGSFDVEEIAVKPAYQILSDRLHAWDLETISEKTDIPVDTIEELAALYTSDLSMVILGFGQDHYANGQTFYDGLFALADITGMEAKHGAGSTCVDLTGAAAMVVLSTATAGLPETAVPGPTAHAHHFPELMEKGELGGIKAPTAVYLYYINPIGNLPDRKAWLKALDAMELVVISDMFMCETANYADYVLPAAFPYEHADLTYMQTGFVKLLQKAVEPLGEAKNDFDIITELGKGMGFGEYFTQTIDEFLRDCINNDVAAAYDVNYEALQENHAMWAYPEEPAVVGLNAPIITPTGRFEFYHEGVQPQWNVGQEFDQMKESCWFWEPPLEAWHENELFEKYPLIFISERAKFKTHTMFNDVPMLLELDPEPILKIAPADAEARGISEGDTVKIYNDRGYLVIKAVINAGVRPGVLVIDHGWQEKDFIEGHYSDLSSCAGWPRFEQDNWFDALCEMEKVQ